MKKLIIFFLTIFLFSCVSAGNYGGGTYGSGLYGIGEVIITITSPGTGGGGGGSCIYNWSCTNWFPSECPISETQERICANRGTCTGATNMPSQIRNCTYEHKEPLFDIFLKISNKNICAGRKIKANINLENYGKQELLDAFMTYWVVNEDNALISELKDTRSITNKLNFDVYLEITESVPNGIYRLYAEITYSGNKTAVAGESFEVNENYCNLINLLPYIIIGIVLVVILILIFILFKKFHHLKNGKIKSKKKIIKKPFKPKSNFIQKIKRNFKKYQKERANRKMLREIIRQKKTAERRNMRIKRKKKLKFFKLSKLKKKRKKIVSNNKKKRSIHKEKVEVIKSILNDKGKIKRKETEEKYRKEKLEQIKKKHSIS